MYAEQSIFTLHNTVDGQRNASSDFAAYGSYESSQIGQHDLGAAHSQAAG
jgi:hypothetical protein